MLGSFTFLSHLESEKNILNSLLRWNISNKNEKILYILTNIITHGEILSNWPEKYIGLFNESCSKLFLSRSSLNWLEFSSRFSDSSYSVCRLFTENNETLWLQTKNYPVQINKDIKRVRIQLIKQTVFTYFRILFWNSPTAFFSTQICHINSRWIYLFIHELNISIFLYQLVFNKI